MTTSLTITGADDSVDPYRLVHLSRFFPFVEWGVLFSASRRAARYPSFVWLKELERLALRHPMTLSMHLCGREARMATAAADDIASFLPGAPWTRVQFNGYEPSTAKSGWRHSRFYSRVPASRFILQARSPDTLKTVLADACAADADVLFDPSGGTGSAPSVWPTVPIPPNGEGRFLRCGFAGGITPENIRDVIADVITKNKSLTRVWFDVESGVRTDDVLDFDKVQSVLESVQRIRKEARQRRE